MSLLFYDHLINKKDLHDRLDSLDLPPESKSNFKKMIDEIIHTGLVEFILQKLHPHQHKTFLHQLDHTPYDPELIQYLRDHIDEEIENQIRDEGERLKKLILRDLKN